MGYVATNDFGMALNTDSQDEGAEGLGFVGGGVGTPSSVLPSKMMMFPQLLSLGFPVFSGPVCVAPEVLDGGK